MKNVLIIFLLLISFTSFGQNIPNGDFEKWEKRDHYKLDNWYSPTRNVERTADAKVGNYAVKLKNTYSSSNNGTRGYIRNIDYADDATLDGFEFGDDPLSLVFWSKHDLAAGDTARIFARFRYKGSTKGTVDFRFSGSSNNEFIKYSVPISWSGSRTPDSVWLYMYSYIHNKVQGDGFVIFDDVHFEKIGQRMDDVTNASFEDWTNYGVDYPQSWNSLDLIVYDYYTSFLPSKSVVQVSNDEVFMGNHSLKIQNYNNYGAPRYGYGFVGPERNDYYTPAFPVKDTFKYVQGYYKYLPDGEDTAMMMYRTWEKGSGRSYDELYLQKAENWTFFTLPINYYNSTSVPDSAALLIYSTRTDSIHGFNSAIYLDNLELVMQPKSMSVQNISEEINFYPNPTKSQITINVEEPYNVLFYNQTGQLIKQLNISAGQNIIQLNDVPSGLYFTKFTSNTNQWTTKILKQ